MKFENTEVWGFEHAIRGMRNPLNSWDKSDSCYLTINEIAGHHCDDGLQKEFVIGENDLKLMQKLIRAGSEHRKFLRQIFVSVDITAPSYLMAELDTYKVGVTRNSCSFMHKGTSKAFEIEDFEYDDERIKDILSTRKTILKNQIIYPYETDDFKIYTTENGRTYQIYKNGKVFAEPFSYTDTKGRYREFPKREVHPTITPNGYWELNLGGRQCEKWLLHRLVAFMWVDNPNAFLTVDHIDCNKNNNSADNLEWVSIQENVRRESQNGLTRKDNIKADYLNWKKSSKLTPIDKAKIRELYRNKDITYQDLAVKFNIGIGSIHGIIYNKNTSCNTELFEECWMWEQILNHLNSLRDIYLETKDYKYFRIIRQLLPQSYLYRSTITMNYENILTMYRQRKSHKLNEWSGIDNSELPNFVSWAKTLPYANELICIE